MTTNPLTQEDPTVAAQYFEGRWVQKGRYLTTHDVARLQQNLTATVERINSNRTLSTEAKRVAIAKVYRDTRNQIQAASQAALDHVTNERNRLARKLFGHEGDADPTTVIVRRDAADRAAKLTDPNEAQRALQRAEANGDVHLAQAIAAHAQAHMWSDVVSSYLTARPEAGEAAQQLNALPDPNDGAWRIQHAMTYAVMPPAELGGMPDYAIDRLADTVLDDGGTAA